MWKQICLLAVVQLCDMGGINQVRYGKDRKKRNRLIMLLVIFVMLGLIMAGYAGMLSYGCIAMGMGDVIPAYMLAVVSLLILFFSVFKAGSIVFDLKSYERLIALPFKPAAIIVSRFLTMYVQNVGLGLLILLPAAGVYGYFLRPGVSFYLLMLVGAFLLPLLPMTIATAIGAAVVAVTSRMKHKSIVAAILTILFVIGIIVVPMSYTGDQTFTLETMQDITGIVRQQLFGLYPPARLFSAGVVDGNLGAYAGFAGLSIGLFVLLVALVQWKYTVICMALNSRRAAQNYKLRELTSERPLKALYRKELKRYMASSLYMMNTAVGYLMMVMLAAGIFFTGPQKIEEMLAMPGIVERAVPFLLALVVSFASTTVSSISMEGKQWWIAQSLPVSSKLLFDGKILVNLTVALPCYAVSELLLLLSMKGSFWETVWMLLIPLVYILFIAVAGITINCKLPSFQWESEAAVVKQSAAMLAAMLIGFAVVLVPTVLLLVSKEAYSNLVMGGTVIVMGGVTAFLYRKNCRVDIRTIG